MAGSTERMPIGVVVECRKIVNRWRDWRWQAVEVVPELAAGTGWQELRRGDGWSRFVQGGLALELHRKATEDYKYALSAVPAQLYVVLRSNEGEPVPFRPFLITASPWEAQACQDSGEDVIDAVPMPDLVAAWVEEFVAGHHVDQPFFERQRKAAQGSDKAAGEGSDFVRASVSSMGSDRVR
jgi:Protein of unknown function (DUF3305)